MTKGAIIYSCAKCEAQTSKWSGRCLECGAWGSLREEDGAATENGKNGFKKAKPLKPVPFSSENASAALTSTTKFAVLDGVLGGGLVAGSVTLLAGEPGIGKSTLLAQTALALSTAGQNVLYVTGEESPSQIRRRLDRLTTTIPPTLFFLDDTNASVIAATVETEKPALTIVDSVQMLHCPEVKSEPGSVTQIKACAATLAQAAKSSNAPVLLIGQVTKDGDIAGPRVLEHLVDTVLYLEGDRERKFRLLRVIKHRFGGTDEISVLNMTEKGLSIVEDPSNELLRDRAYGVSGSAITCLIEGRRALLLELQALITPAGYGTPVRRSTGVDGTRLGMLLAVLARRAGVNALEKDVYANAVGGIDARDHSIDLAICASVASALKDMAIDPRMGLFGEIGLAGELRPVALPELRLKELKRLGFNQAIVPKGQGKISLTGMETKEAATLREALQIAKLI